MVISRSSFSAYRSSYSLEVCPKSGKVSTEEPRPAVISTRPPPEMASAVANCWKMRTGSSVPMMLAALPSLIRVVAAAAAAIMAPGEDAGMVVVWCSPTPK